MPANKTASKNMGVRLNTSSSPLIENLVRAMALTHNDHVRARFSIFVYVAIRILSSLSAPKVMRGSGYQATDVTVQSGNPIWVKRMSHSSNDSEEDRKLARSKSRGGRTRPADPRCLFGRWKAWRLSSRCLAERQPHRLAHVAHGVACQLLRLLAAVGEDVAHQVGVVLVMLRALADRRELAQHGVDHRLLAFEAADAGAGAAGGDPLAHTVV